MKREAKKVLVNLQPRAEREAEKSWSTYHLERSERLKSLGQPTISSGARGCGVLVNLQPRAEREAKGVLVNLLPRAKREA